MRKLDEDLDEVLTTKGISEAGKLVLLDLLLGAASGRRAQVEGLRANSIMLASQAEALEPEAIGIEAMLNQLTIEVPDEEEPVNGEGN